MIKRGGGVLPQDVPVVTSAEGFSFRLEKLPAEYRKSSGF